MTIFHEDLVAIERLKIKLLLNKPIYIGMTVLDLSKMLMYDFHYRYIKERYPDGKSELLFTDTDSLCYAIKTADVYQDILEDKHLFDFSDYPITHKCFSAENKKKIGKMKDELKSVSLREVIGLKPKMYSLLYSEKNKIIECKKAKGVKKSTLKTKISHADYKNTLLNNSVLNASATTYELFFASDFESAQGTAQRHSEMKIRSALHALPSTYQNGRQ